MLRNDSLGGTSVTKEPVIMRCCSRASKQSSMINVCRSRGWIINREALFPVVFLIKRKFIIDP